MLLQTDSDFSCVLYVEDDNLLKTRPVSEWLLRRLRRYQPRLVNCGDDLSQSELLLGPVRWLRPSREATVSFGRISPMTGRAGYNLHRGFLWRWHLTPFVRE